MKKLTILLVYFAVVSCKNDCCKDFPYEMGISATGLMQAYRDLVKNNGVSICNQNSNPKNPTYNITSGMSASGYNSSGKSGIVTFTAFYYQDSTCFRTIWGDSSHNNLAFNYYGACIPNPIVFPFPHDNTQNHVYAARLIPVVAYQGSSAPKTYVGLAGVGLFKTKDISRIENIRLEAASGYISTNETVDYNNINSSKGFICDVTLKGNTSKIPCYIINNYDTAGTLIWKVKKDCSQ